MRQLAELRHDRRAHQMKTLRELYLLLRLAQLQTCIRANEQRILQSGEEIDQALLARDAAMFELRDIQAAALDPAVPIFLAKR